MSRQFRDVYIALKDAGASEKKAQAVVKALVAGKESRCHRLAVRLRRLIALVAVNLILTAGVWFALD